MTTFASPGWTLTPLRTADELAEAFPEEELLDAFQLGSFQQVMDDLQIIFYHYPDGSFQMIRSGPDVHPCDRVLADRTADLAYAGTWLDPDRETRPQIFSETLPAALREEYYRRRLHEAEHGLARAAHFWLTRKLLRPSYRGSEEWSQLVLLLNKLESRGFNDLDMHDFFYHHEAWQQRNPDYAGMPQDLVLRAHGFGMLNGKENRPVGR